MVNSKTMFVGDSNIDTLVENSCSKGLKNLSKSYNFVINNANEATRVTNRSSTCIDHIISNFPVATHNVISGISDHNIIFADINVVSNIDDNLTFRNLSFLKKSTEKILFLADVNYLLKNVPEGTCDEKVEFLIKTIIDCLDVFAPLKVYGKKRKVKSQWITPEIRKLIFKRDRLLRQLQACWSTETHVNYKIIRNKVNALLRLEKRNFYTKKVEKVTNSKDLFKIFKNVGIGKTGNNTTTHIDANKLNTFFCNIGSKIASQIPYSSVPICRSPKQVQSMVMFETNHREVLDVINSLKSKFSCGPDDICNEIIRQLGVVIAPLISDIFNECIHLDVFPDLLKIAKVVPMFKDGDKTDPSNYRPISLLSCLSKVVEKLIHSRLINFFEKFSILNMNQYGFRSKRSTIQAVARLTEFVRDATNKRADAIALFLDLKKAFDTIDHKILMQKLDHYGIRGKSNNLIRAYLTNRKQYVEIGNNRSTLENVSTGVPQGSVLGPLLFLIYINDLPDSTSLDTTLFADDTSIMTSGKNSGKKLRTEFDKVYNYLCCNKLSLNTDKTVLLNFSKKNGEIGLDIKGECIKMVDCTKYLGIYIDSKLDFKMHIEHVIKKLSKLCGVIYRSRKLFNIPMLLLIYRSYIKPVLQYGVLVYGCANLTDLNKILVIQKRIIRATFRIDYRESTVEKYRLHKIETVFDLHVYELFKDICYNNVCDSTTANNVAYFTRRVASGKVNSKIQRTKCFQNSINVRRTIIHNYITASGLLNEDVTSLQRHQLKIFIHYVFDNYLLDNKEVHKQLYCH